MTEEHKVKLKQSLEDLKKLLEADLHLKFFAEDDEYLQRFLYATDLNAQKAFEKMKIFYDLLLEYPQWMAADAPLEHRDLILKKIRLVFPGLDKQGRPIYLLKLGNVDPSKMNLQDIVAVDDICLELVLSNSKSKASLTGLCVLVDIKDYSWKMMRWLTPYNIKIAIRKIQGLPFRDYSIHVVNDAALVHAAIKIIWPFMPDWLKDMVKYHFNDRESLYKYIDPGVLPPEYGGTDTNINYDHLAQDILKNNDVIAGNFSKFRNLEMFEQRMIPG